MAQLPKIVAEFEQYTKDLLQRDAANRANNTDLANEHERLDAYMINVAPCDRTWDILEVVTKKVEAIPEATDIYRHAKPIALVTYRLPKGMANPISSHDTDFEGKVTVQSLTAKAMSEILTNSFARTMAHATGRDEVAIKQFLRKEVASTEEDKDGSK
ncbi:hypothetical protein LTR17_010851 [Elasticomyces elasticus]|nr:hypothetical protein LTR17_010851 [Elasticomyces elasticus]